MKLIKQTDLKRRMLVLVSALTAIAAGVVLGLVIPMVLQSDSDTSSGKLDYDLSPYNASAWFVGPPANMDEFVGKMDAIVVAEVTSVIGSDERNSYNEQDNNRNIKEGDLVSSALPVTDYNLTIGPE